MDNLHTKMIATTNKGSQNLLQLRLDQQLLNDSNTKNNSMIDRRVSLFYRISCVSSTT